MTATGRLRRCGAGASTAPPDASFYEFERSWQFDRRLLPQELALDRAWARAITAAGILTREECERLVTALDEIEARAKTDAAWLDASKAEDVHHFAETALIEKLGPLGAKLHTGRSRNEMVATEFRMYATRRGARNSLGGRAAAPRDRRAGRAQPRHSHARHHAHAACAAAAAFALASRARRGLCARCRAAARLPHARADVCPLGSGALAGCAFPLDRKALARDLGFSRITANSLDAVSDRDFALEFLFALATLAMHLSRLSEDMILFASPEFGFVELPDEYSTGSSLMPQKKNPDAWELIRGKTGRMYGSLFALLTTCKGLPSSYQRDLQEDKEPALRGARSGARDGADRRSCSGCDAFPRGSPARGRAGSRPRRHRAGRLSRRQRRSLPRGARNRGQGPARSGAGWQIDPRDAASRG